MTHPNLLWWVLTEAGLTTKEISELPRDVRRKLIEFIAPIVVKRDTKAPRNAVD